MLRIEICYQGGLPVRRPNCAQRQQRHGAVAERHRRATIDATLGEGTVHLGRRASWNKVFLCTLISTPFQRFTTSTIAVWVVAAKSKRHFIHPCKHYRPSRGPRRTLPGPGHQLVSRSSSIFRPAWRLECRLFPASYLQGDAESHKTERSNLSQYNVKRLEEARFHLLREAAILPAPTQHAFPFRLAAAWAARL